MKSIEDLPVSGHRVLLRADLNVPLDLSDPEHPRITDDGRIRASLPTIQKLTDRGARVVIMAHLGRPKGADYAERAAGGPSLRPIAARHGVSVSAVAVAWTLAWPGVTGAIVGARSAEQVDGWIAAGKLELTPSDLTEIARAIDATGAGGGPARPVGASATAGA